VLRLGPNQAANAGSLLLIGGEGCVHAQKRMPELRGRLRPSASPPAPATEPQSARVFVRLTRWLISSFPRDVPTPCTTYVKGLNMLCTKAAHAGNETTRSL